MYSLAHVAVSYISRFGQRHNLYARDPSETHGSTCVLSSACFYFYDVSAKQMIKTMSRDSYVSYLKRIEIHFVRI